MYALISEARSSRQIPVSVHAAVAPVFIGTALGSVTLGAQTHGFYHREGFSRGETKQEGLARFVAGGACEVAVVELESLVELGEVVRRARWLSHVDLCVTRFAADAGRLAALRQGVGLDGREVLRGSDTHLEGRFTGRRLERIGSVLAAACEGQAAPRSGEFD